LKLAAHRFAGSVEYPVDAVLDDHTLLACFNMDITGAAVHGVQNRGIEQLDDRAGVFGNASNRQDLFPWSFSFTNCSMKSSETSRKTLLVAVPALKKSLC